MKPTITIFPKKALRYLLAATALVILLGIAAALIRKAPWFGALPGDGTFTRLFHLDAEANIPTWFSSSLLLLCSGLCAVIALLKRDSGDRWRRHWAALAPIIAYLSMDEAASIHENLIWNWRPLRDLSPVLYYPWVVAGIAFVGLFLLAYARFYCHLPRRTQALFLLAGATYVGGALGLEMVGSAYIGTFGRGGMMRVILLFEESLEMLGIAIFAYALIAYLGDCIGPFLVRPSQGQGANSGEEALAET
jgi:hypothetical protein